MIWRDRGARSLLRAASRSTRSGGDGVRWQEREASAAAARDGGRARFSSPRLPQAASDSPNGLLRLARTRPLGLLGVRTLARARLPRRRQELQLHPCGRGAARRRRRRASRGRESTDAVARPCGSVPSASPGSALPDPRERSETRTSIATAAGLVEVSEAEADVIPLADTKFVESTGVWIIKSLVIFVFVLGSCRWSCCSSASSWGASRTVRPQPRRPFGLLQPLADVVKLISKEQFDPTPASPSDGAGSGDLDPDRRRGFAIIPFGVVNMARHRVGL